jgi:exonuclease VII large subunit
MSDGGASLWQEAGDSLQPLMGGRMTPYETTEALRPGYSTVSQIRNRLSDKVRRVETAISGECMAPQWTGERWNFDLVSVSSKDVDFLPCTVWENQAPKIEAKLREAGFSLEEAMTAGMTLEVTGTTWLGKDGRVHVRVTAIEPGYVRRGSLHLQDKAAMATIGAAGIASHRLCQSFTHDNPTSAFQAIDRLPKRVMVLGPPGAQGIGDFKRRLGNNRTSSPQVVYRALSWTPAGNIRTVQEHFDEAHRQDMDLVLLVQGGGHWSMLRGYERADLALAIHRSRVPVATAVGHDANVSLADRAATLSFITPTAAAEAIVNALNHQYFRGKKDSREAAAQKRRKADHAARTAERQAAASEIQNLKGQIANREDELVRVQEAASQREFELGAKVYRAAAAHTLDLLEAAEQRVRFISRLATATTAIMVAALIRFGQEILSLVPAGLGPANYWLYVATVIFAGAAVVVRQQLARRKITLSSAKPMRYPHPNADSWRQATKTVRTIRGLRKLRHHTPL